MTHSRESKPAFLRKRAGHARERPRPTSCLGPATPRARIGSHSITPQTLEMLRHEATSILNGLPLFWTPFHAAEACREPPSPRGKRRRRRRRNEVNMALQAGIKVGGYKKNNNDNASMSVFWRQRALSIETWRSGTICERRRRQSVPRGDRKQEGNSPRIDALHPPELERLFFPHQEGHQPPNVA